MSNERDERVAAKSRTMMGYGCALNNAFMQFSLMALVDMVPFRHV